MEPNRWWQKTCFPDRALENLDVPRSAFKSRSLKRGFVGFGLLTQSVQEHVNTKSAAEHGAWTDSLSSGFRVLALRVERVSGYQNLKHTIFLDHEIHLARNEFPQKL